MAQPSQPQRSIDAGGVHRLSQITTVQDYIDDLAWRVETGEPSAWHQGLQKYFRALSYRLEKVDLFHGDWKRCVSRGVINRTQKRKGITGIFFDPPYSPDACESENIYLYCGNVAKEVEEWCRAHQDRTDLRIALCAYAGTVNLPGWTEYAWVNSGGAKGKRGLERIFFSPSCLP
jgi:hypothetical protein